MTADEDDFTKEVDTAIDGLNRMATAFLQLGSDVHALAVMLEAKAIAHDPSHLERMQELSQTCKRYLEIFEIHFSRLRNLASKRPVA